MLPKLGAWPWISGIVIELLFQPAGTEALFYPAPNPDRRHSLERLRLSPTRL